MRMFAVSLVLVGNAFGVSHHSHQHNGPAVSKPHNNLIKRNEPKSKTVEFPKFKEVPNVTMRWEPPVKLRFSTQLSGPVD